MWPTINQLCNTVNKDCVLAQRSVPDMLEDAGRLWATISIRI